MEYNQITNPFDQDNMIQNIIECYCDKHTFYNGLTHHYQDKETRKYSVYYCNALNVCLFNSWKKQVLKFISQKRYPKEEEYRYQLLARYLESQDPRTAEEVNQVLEYGDISNKELAAALRQTRYNKVGEFSSWTHVDSSYVVYGDHKGDNIEHRLYINCDSTYTHQILFEFCKRCHQTKTKYYFKYDIYGDRDDTIVFYSDTKHLQTYIDFLNDIKKDLHLDDHIHEPPLLTGKIDGWIGYGSEPQEENGKVVYSFNEKREKHLEKCIQEETKDYIHHFLNDSFQINGNTMTYQTYLISKMIATKKKKLVRYLNDSPDTIHYYGYGLKDVSTPEFDIAMRRYLQGNMSTILKELEKGDDFLIKVPFRNGFVTFNAADKDELMKAQTKFFSRMTKNYNNNLKKRILDTAYQFDIDKDNYAVDVSRKKCFEKPVVKNVRVETPLKEDGKYSLSFRKRVNIDYTPMNNDEIKASQEKLGIR